MIIFTNNTCLLSKLNINIIIEVKFRKEPKTEANQDIIEFYQTCYFIDSTN